MFFTIIIAFGILVNALPISSNREVTSNQIFQLSRMLSKTYNSASATVASSTVVPTVSLQA
jgi:hypothetical protein